MLSPRHYSDRLFHYSDPPFHYSDLFGSLFRKTLFRLSQFPFRPHPSLISPSPCSLATPWAFGAFQAFSVLFLPFTRLSRAGSLQDGGCLGLFSVSCGLFSLSYPSFPCFISIWDCLGIFGYPFGTLRLFPYLSL